MTQALYNTITKVTDLSLRSISTNKLFVFGIPSSFTLDRGITLKEVSSTSALGETVLADVYVDAQKPTFEAQFPSKTPELMALMFGRALASGSKTGIVSGTFPALAGSYAGAAASTDDGYGMSADQASSLVSALIDGKSVALTRQTYGTWNSATPLTFAQGAHGALLLSDDVVAAKYFVTKYFEYTISGADYISETLDDEFIANAIAIDTNKRLTRIYMPKIKINVQATGKLDFGQEGINISAYVAYDGTQCEPLSVTFMNRRRVC